MKEKGLSLLEVSLAITFLTLSLSFYWKSKGDESNFDYAKELSSIVQEHATALSQYLQANPNTPHSGYININDVYKNSNLPLRADGNDIGSYKIFFLVSKHGNGLVILSGTSRRNNLSERIYTNLGYLAAKAENDHIYSFGQYIKYNKGDFPALPQDILAMSITPPIITPAYIKGSN
ncbi:hypothetical protein U9527_20135 [Escherichia coli]